MSSAGTSPVAEGAIASEVSEVEANDNVATVENTEADQPAGDTEGDTAEQPDQAAAADEDSEEIEHDGKKLRIPKALKGAFMMHSDYTKKTQEVAELRRQVEAERGNNIAADKEQIALAGKLQFIGEQLASYQNVDWDTLQATNPEAYDQHWRKFTRLQADQQAVNQSYTQAAQKRHVEMQRHIAKLTDEASAQLPNLIPGYSDELSERIAKYGTAQGFTREEMKSATIHKPLFAAMLNKARQWDEYQASQKVAKRAANQETARPVAEIGSKAPAAKNPDRMTMDEWVKYEKTRMAKAAR